MIFFGRKSPQSDGEKRISQMQDQLEQLNAIRHKKWRDQQEMIKKHSIFPKNHD